VQLITICAAVKSKCAVEKITSGLRSAEIVMKMTIYAPIARILLCQMSGVIRNYDGEFTSKNSPGIISSGQYLIPMWYDNPSWQRKWAEPNGLPRRTDYHTTPARAIIFLTSTLPAHPNFHSIPAQPWQNPKNRLFSTQNSPFYHFNLTSPQ